MEICSEAGMREYWDSWKVTCSETELLSCCGEYWYVKAENCVGMVLETELVDVLLE
jgi:hypothetical protein